MMKTTNAPQEAEHNRCLRCDEDPGACECDIPVYEDDAPACPDCNDSGWRRDPYGTTVECWTPGCATGEEAFRYGNAIALEALRESEDNERQDLAIEAALDANTELLDAAQDERMAAVYCGFAPGGPLPDARHVHKPLFSCGRIGCNECVTLPYALCPKCETDAEIAADRAHDRPLTVADPRANWTYDEIFECWASGAKAGECLDCPNVALCSGEVTTFEELRDLPTDAEMDALAEQESEGRADQQDIAGLSRGL